MTWSLKATRLAAAGLVVAGLLVGAEGTTSAASANVHAAPASRAATTPSVQRPGLRHSIRQRTVVRTNLSAGRAVVSNVAQPADTTPDPDGGTDVCGGVVGQNDTTTWTAAGAPYKICAAGVLVYGTLVLDGSAGGFEVQAQGAGGLAGGHYETANTSSTDRITFDSVGGATWGGLSSSGDEGITLFDLDHVTIDSASAAVSSDISNNADPGAPPSVSLDDVVVNNATGEGFSFNHTNVTLTNSAVDGSGGDGILAYCSAVTPSTAGYDEQVDVTGTQVSGAARIGIDIQDCDDPQVSGDTVLNSGTTSPAQPAISVTSGLGPPPFDEIDRATTVDLGAADGVSDDSGAGNGIDAIAVAGVQQGGFTWITPTDSATSHPLGYLDLGLSVQGTGVVTVPAGAVVKSEADADVGNGVNSDLLAGLFRIDGPSLVVLSGAVFTSLNDDSVGLPTCNTALAASCTPSATDWAGLMPMGGAVFASDTIEHATTCLASISPIGIPSALGLPITADSMTVTDCIAGIQTGPITLTNSAISDIEAPTFGEDYDEAIYASGTVILTNDAATDCPYFGNVSGGPGDGGVTVRAGLPATAATDSIDVSDVTLTDCGSFLLDGPSQPTAATPAPLVHGVTVIGSSLDAAFITDPDVSIGVGADIGPISGHSNANDRIDLNVGVDGDLDWITPTNSATTHTFGYYGTVNMLGGTMTVPQNGVVQPARITLTGGKLVATAGGETFEGDAQLVGNLTMLTGALGQAPSVDLDGVNWTNLGYVDDDAPSGSSVTIANSTLNALPPSPAIDPQPPNIYVSSGKLSVSDSKLDYIALSADGAGTYSVTDTTMDVSNDYSVGPQPAVTAGDGATFAMNSTQVTDTNQGVAASDNGLVTGRCDAFIKVYNEVTTDQTGQVTITDSDLPWPYYDAPFSGRVQTMGGQVDVERDWWGGVTPPTGPDIDSSDPVATPYPTSTFAFSGSAAEADGGIGTGTLDVTETFDRQMDTTTDPTVTLTTSAGGSRTLSGSWTDSTHWAASTVIATADDGPATIAIGGGRGCANDPIANTEAPATQTVFIGPPQRPVIGEHPVTTTPAVPTATFAFAAYGATRGYDCALDGKTSACTSPFTRTKLTAGTHHFAVSGVDDAGIGPAATFAWVVDPIPPRITVRSAPPALLLASTAKYTVKVTSGAPKAAAEDVEVRYREEAPGKALGSYHEPSSWRGHDKKATVTLHPKTGYTYCFSARAGKAARWSSETCTTHPLDDRILTGYGWKHISGADYYDKTLSRSTDQFAPIGNVQESVRADHVWVRSWTCQTCGKLYVYFAGKKVATMNLQRDGATRGVTRSIELPGVESGMLSFSAPSSTQPGDVDAVGSAIL